MSAIKSATVTPELIRRLEEYATNGDFPDTREGWGWAPPSTPERRRDVECLLNDASLFLERMPPPVRDMRGWAAVAWCIEHLQAGDRDWRELGRRCRFEDGLEENEGQPLDCLVEALAQLLDGVRGTAARQSPSPPHPPRCRRPDVARSTDRTPSPTLEGHVVPFPGSRTGGGVVTQPKPQPPSRAALGPAPATLAPDLLAEAEGLLPGSAWTTWGEALVLFTRQVEDERSRLRRADTEVNQRAWGLRQRPPMRRALIRRLREAILNERERKSRW